VAKDPVPVLGVVCGLDREAAWFPTGSGETRVAVLVGGMGHRRAAAAARSLAARGVRGLVSWGSAAALDPALAPGDLLLPEGVITARRGSLPAHTEWRTSLAEALAGRIGTVEAPLAEAPAVLATPEEKRSLREATGAAAADMETAAVAEVAGRAGLPWVALRAVADTAEDSLPAAVLSNLTTDGAVDAGAILRSAGLSPRVFLSLLGLGRSHARAGKTLRRAARAAGPLLRLPAALAPSPEVP